MDEDKAKSVVVRLLDVLSDRGGFDGWWDGIDEETQDEIKDELVTVLLEEVQ